MKYLWCTVIIWLDLEIARKVIQFVLGPVTLFSLSKSSIQNNLGKVQGLFIFFAITEE